MYQPKITNSPFIFEKITTLKTKGKGPTPYLLHATLNSDARAATCPLNLAAHAAARSPEPRTHPRCHCRSETKETSTNQTVQNHHHFSVEICQKSCNAAVVPLRIGKLLSASTTFLTIHHYRLMYRSPEQKTTQIAASCLKFLTKPPPFWTNHHHYYTHRSQIFQIHTSSRSTHLSPIFRSPSPITSSPITTADDRP